MKLLNKMQIGLQSPGLTAICLVLLVCWSVGWSVIISKKNNKLRSQGELVLLYSRPGDEEIKWRVAPTVLLMTLT